MIRNLPFPIPGYRSFLLSAVLLSVAAGPAANAQTVTIFRNGAAIAPVYSTVKAAVAAARSMDSLVLSPHTFNEHDILVDSSISFTGTKDASGSSIIDAKGLGRVMRINAANAQLRNLKLTNGAVNNGAGAGIYYLGSGTLRLSGNTWVTNCRSTGVYSRGGGIFSNGILMLRDSTMLSGNYAYEDGGGIYAGNDLDIREDVVIETNKADGSGGGVFCTGSGETTIIGQVAIRNNTAAVSGGGMFSPGTITGSVAITGNKAEFGGGIAAFSGDLILRDAVSISNNTATTAGGGVWVNNGHLLADGGFQITGNKILTATGSYNFGAAIYQVNGSMNLRGGNITGNRSPFAAIHVSSSSSESVRVTSCHLYNPGTDGTRLSEINCNSSTPGSYITVSADSCWWGSNASYGLVTYNNSGVYTTAITSPVFLKWWMNDGLPVDPAQKTIKLEAHFFIVDVDKLDSLTLRSIHTNFTADNGTFTPPTSWIGLNNVASSEYTVPEGADSVELIAYTDADTFRSGKIYVAGALSIKGTLMSQLKVYPNPVWDILSVDGLAAGSELSLYGLDGRLLQRQTVQGAKEQYTMSGYAPGTYILQVSSSDGRKTSFRVQKR